MTDPVEDFLQQCRWASEADKNVLRAFIDHHVARNDDTAEGMVLRLRNDLEKFQGGHESRLIASLARYLAWQESHSVLDEELAKAVEQQDLELARALVGQGVSMNNGYHKDGFLITYIANGLLDEVLWIIEHARELKVDINLQDSYEWEWKDDRFPGYREHVAAYLDIEDRLGWQQGPTLRHTPLILALKKGWDHIDTQYDPATRERPPPRMGAVVKALLEAGATPDIQDGCGNTALHIALLHRDERAVRLLLKHGARLDIRNNAGLLPAAMLNVRYRDINPFLYQQTGNNVNDYIYTLKDYDSWRKAGAEMHDLLAQNISPANPPQYAAGLGEPSGP